MAVSAKNPNFKKDIQEAEKRLKRRGKLPKTPIRMWTAHIRYAAVAERGGRISIAELPTRMVSPHGPPPPEAYEELLGCGILRRCSSTCNLFTDGAHAWPLLVKEYNKLTKSSIAIKEVAHCNGEYAKRFRPRRQGQSSLAGTQGLDSRWKWMKAYVPDTLHARVNRKANPRLSQYVFPSSFERTHWRQNSRSGKLWLMQCAGTGQNSTIDGLALIGITRVGDLVPLAPNEVGAQSISGEAQLIYMFDHFV